jgi:transposase
LNFIYVLEYPFKLRVKGFQKRKARKEMEVKPVLVLPEELELVEMEKVDERLRVTIVSTKRTSYCPLCGVMAEKVHSRYVRQATDLPCSGQPIRLLILVRKYFCQEEECPRKIFVERLTPFIDLRGRVTQRLFQVVQVIGLATGGRLGVRVTNRIGIQTSRQTILRRIMALPNEPVGQVLQVGVDDFSFKRARTFGTIIVDLQTHQVLDVLADRTAESTAAWMAAHPEITLVSRDRGGDYAAAATTSAPQATQCADRFHLLANLGKVLEGVLSRHLAALRNRKTEQARVIPLPPDEQPKGPTKKLTKKEALSQAKREERLALYQQVVTLREQGFSQPAIAEVVGIGHATVSRWLRHGAFPERQPIRCRMAVDPYLPQLIEQWETGCYTAAQLHRDLVANGYSHSYDSVYRQLIRVISTRQKRQYVRTPAQGEKKQETPQPLPRPPVLARQAMFLFLRQPETLSVLEQETLTQLRSLHTEVDQAYEFVQQFAQMLRQLSGQQLDSWLYRVKESRIREFQGFVAGVMKDKEAVVAGLTLPQSNDHVA